MAKQNGTSRSSQSRSSSQKRSGGGGGARQSASGGSQRRQATSSKSRRGGAQQREQPQQRPQDQSTRRGAVAGAGTKVVDTVRENPIPAALIGAGLTWLLVKNRQRLPAPHLPEAFSGLADTARESFSGTAQSTRDAVRGGVGSAAEAVKDRAAMLAEYAQSGASKAGQAAKKGFERSRDAVATTWDEHPLTVGLTLLAAGVAAGMMLPAPKSGAITRAAKGLTQRVTATGEELLNNARELVTSSAQAASREARRQGLAPDQLGRKVKRVAKAATP